MTPRVHITTQCRLFRKDRVCVLWLETAQVWTFRTKQDAQDFVATHLPGEAVEWRTR